MKTMLSFLELGFPRTEEEYLEQTSVAMLKKIIQAGGAVKITFWAPDHMSDRSIIIHKPLEELRVILVEKILDRGE